MLDEMLIISELNLFDYSIKIGEPKKADDELYGLPTRIFVTPNENYNNIVSIFQTTISALSMSETEQKDYSKTNEKYYKYDENYKPGYGEFLDEANGFMNSKGWLINNFPFVLRNNIESFRSKLEQLRNNIWKSSMSFKILDNIGNYSIPIHVIVKDEHSCENTGCDWPIYVVERRGTTTYDIYGITSNHSFLGGALCVGGCGFPTIWKPLYYTEDEILIDHVLWPVTYNDPAENTCKWRRNKEMKVRNNINLIFCGGDYKVTALGTRRRDYTLEQSCLDLSYETYPYFIYLYYNEKDISKVTSITIEPTNPKEINTINR